MIRICADSGGNPHAADGQSPRCSAHRAQRKRYTDTACQRRKRRLPQVEYRPEPSPFGSEARVLSDEDVAYLDDLLDLVRIALVPLNLASRRHLPYPRGDVDALLNGLDELLIAVQGRIAAPSRRGRGRGSPPPPPPAG